MLLIDCIYKTNYYRLLLLDIVSIASTKQLYYIGFIFIKAKKYNDYKVIIKYILEAYKALNLDLLVIILTNKEKTLCNIIKDVFLNIKYIIYIWYI